MVEPQEETIILPAIWNPMLDAFMKLIDLVEWHGSIEIQTQLDRFDNHPLTSPLVTIYQEPDKSLAVDISGNAELLPKLTEVEYELMALLGWQKPWASKDEDYGDYPNFVKQFSKDAREFEIAESILYALVTVYGMKRTDLIAVEDLNIAEWLDETSLLHRLELEPSNDERLLFRIETEEDHNE